MYQVKVCLSCKNSEGVLKYTQKSMYILNGENVNDKLQ